jgi:transcription elongation factor GreB
MGRRPRGDRPGSGERTSPYITPDGFARLEAEYEHLRGVERPKVTEAVSVAAALGDRSENADYIYGKKRLREIDARMRFLMKRIDVLEIVRTRPDREDKVFFGAWVGLEDESGERVCYRVVGADESDPATRAISMDSPVGRALLGKQEGDEVKVQRPRGAGLFTIVSIDYDAPGDPSDGD